MLEANTDQTTLQIINALLSLLNDRFLYILCKKLEADFFGFFWKRNYGNYVDNLAARDIEILKNQWD